MDNRPQGREKNVTGQGKGLSRRGSGLGTGPVGSSNGHSGRPGSGTNFTPTTGSSGSGRNVTRGSSGGGLIKIIIVLFLIFGGGGGALSLFGGSDSTATAPSSYVQTGSSSSSVSTAGTTSTTGTASSMLETLFGSSGSSTMLQGFNYSSLMSGSSTSTGAGWSGKSNCGVLDTSVDSAAREKRTEILGNGKDTVTIMVYLCGTDLESKSGMATRDLQEMLAAKTGSKVNLIVYTGGCSGWKNNTISSSVNQIYQIKDGNLYCLVKDAGSKAMTSPSTLTSFIQYCTEKFPANRNMLILWDHGGGTISGYGYDETNKNSGSMTLKGINEALKNSKTTFDFIGFDACLMATLETGLTLAPYADYLIASEETEPGYGWYYTDWLTALGSDTSMSTLEIGKNIVDDFVRVCNNGGQKATLSVVDLAELEATVPDSLKSFSESTLELLQSGSYETVSTARSNTREFATSSKIDQVDLVHMALNLDTEESNALADVVLGAVKYNKTTSNMTNAYGLSIYFPYQKLNKVNSAVSAYDAIGMDDAYSDCIRSFASMELAGQTAAGTTSATGSTGSTASQTWMSGSSSSAVSNDMLTQMLTQLMGSSGYYNRALDTEATAEYLANNRFDTSCLTWSSVNGTPVLTMPESNWAMVQTLELSVFADDGEGYIDLGLDTTFDFTVDGALMGTYDGTWLAIDSQPVAYYHLDTTITENGYTITGRVPVLLNGVRAELILVFTDAQPYGEIVGARYVYADGETDTVAKGITALEAGDEITFIADYYSYSGEYIDTYAISDTVAYTGSEVISNVYLNLDTAAVYRLTDIYQNIFWTPEIP